MKYLKDYLHLYLGCECIETLHDNKCQLRSVGVDGRVFVVGDFMFNDILNINYIKPILRPLSDMTEEEKKRLAELLTTSYFEATRYALSLFVDLFGLIESGLAIDATTIKQ